MKKVVKKKNSEKPENSKKPFIKSLGHLGFKGGKMKPSMTFRSQGRKK